MAAPDTTPALVRVYDLVTADLLVRVPAAVSSFGWKQPARQGTTSAHVTWLPGRSAGPNSHDSDMGEDLPARYVGQKTARHLADTKELFTVQIHAHDPTNPSDERIQYVATRTLYHIWRASIYRAALGIHTIETLMWITDKTEFRLGVTLQVVASILTPTPDDGSELLALTAIDLNLILNRTAGPVSPIVIEP